MKCKELMVGDFCRSGHGLPMQITNVGDDYAYATFEGNEGDPWEFDDKDGQPQPIEITGDLLKANGWSEYKCYNIMEPYYVKDEGEYRLMWDLGILTIRPTYKKYDGGIYADCLPIKYVHQFQHVLRLAGMTELANNFKI